MFEDKYQTLTHINDHKNILLVQWMKIWQKKFWWNLCNFFFWDFRMSIYIEDPSNSFLSPRPMAQTTPHPTPSKIYFLRTNFGRISTFLSKNRNFHQKSKFSSKMEIFVKSPNFGENSKFWSKIQILLENRNFGQIIELLIKIQIFVKNQKFGQIF